MFRRWAIEYTHPGCEPSPIGLGDTPDDAWADCWRRTEACDTPEMRAWRLDRDRAILAGRTPPPAPSGPIERSTSP